MLGAMQCQSARGSFFGADGRVRRWPIHTLEVRTREAMPTQWAATQYNLGNVLLSLGEREGNLSRLQQARTAIVGVLEVANTSDHREMVKLIDAAIAKLS